METFEYANLDRVERDHWYYSGKRRIVTAWLQKTRPLAATDTVLDFGAGTGVFALGLLGRCRVLVHDSYPESQIMLRQRFPASSVLPPTTDGIPLPEGAVDAATALDVLEHIEDDAAAVAELYRVLRPGGRLVVTVPASMALWSDWDVTLRHFRRYDRKGLGALFAGPGWEVERLTYTNIFTWPAVYLLRKWRKLRPAAPGSVRAEDKVPPAWLNQLLRFLFTAPAISSWFPAPFGVSLLLVARKR